MLKKSQDEIADFRCFLKNAIKEIEGLDRAQFSLEGEGYLRRCAAIVSEAGLQAVHAGFADLHDMSLQLFGHIERTSALTFLADCLARCRTRAAEEPGLLQAQKTAMMTAAEVAKFLGITGRSVRRRVLDGTLPHPIKIGRSVRFRREDIEAVAANK